MRRPEEWETGPRIEGDHLAPAHVLDAYQCQVWANIRKEAQAAFDKNTRSDGGAPYCYADRSGGVHETWSLSALARATRAERRLVDAMWPEDRSERGNRRAHA